MNDVLEEIRKYKLVPVVVINKIEDAIPFMDSLVNASLPLAEITFRTPCAKDAIKSCIKKYPNALIGAGTVINSKQAEEAIEIGAKFIVSPGLSENVFHVCKKHNVEYFPGVVTPSEIIRALDLGITNLKFFPASDFGGLKTIKALCSAFPQVKFMPTGGVNLENLVDYLSYDKIFAVGGSFMMKGTYSEIEEKTKQAVKLIMDRNL